MITHLCQHFWNVKQRSKLSFSIATHNVKCELRVSVYFVTTHGEILLTHWFSNHRSDETKLFHRVCHENVCLKPSIIV